MSVLSVVGARPQFIKAFSVSRALRKQQEEILVHTGQHYDEELSDVFFEELRIPEPDYNLGVGSGPHGQQTGEMIMELEAVVKKHDPDALLTYGDTNSTLAAAIVGSKVDTTLAHVEAGLRSFNRSMPEEINRVLTDHASDLLFTPCRRAVEQLDAEGITDGVHFTGDVMYDSLLAVREEGVTHSTVLEDVGLDPDSYVLSTVHRPRNTDDKTRLKRILGALSADERPVVLPAHPRTRIRLEEYGLLEEVAAEIELIDPVGYLDFVRLLDNAAVVATDSGGVQKEAFFLRTPCITMREETEWMETVEEGANVLVGADDEKLRTALASQGFPEEAGTPYGDGQASEKIADLLSSG